MMLQNSIYPFELEIKLLFYVLFCRDVIYTLYLSQKRFTHFFVAKTIYTLRPESFCALNFAIRKVQTFWASALDLS